MILFLAYASFGRDLNFHFSCFPLTVGEPLGVFARVEKPVGLTVGSDG